MNRTPNQWLTAGVLIGVIGAATVANRYFGISLPDLAGVIIACAALVGAFSAARIGQRRRRDNRQPPDA
jgi:hypothetical protein